jgi:hypothetical protein
MQRLRFARAAYAVLGFVLAISAQSLVNWLFS